MKMMTQKALSLVLSLTLLLGAVPYTGITAFAAESGDVTAYYCDSGLFKDSSCTEKVEAGDDGYYDSITKAVIKSNTTSIGDFAFENCTNLKSVLFEPDSKLKSIGEQAFYSCTNLTDIVIPDGVETIKSVAFSDCTSLTDITIPSSVTLIDSWAFNQCTNLRNVSFEPNSKLKVINNRAFQTCSSLTGITVPSGVETIGEAAFLQCTSLKSVTIPETVVKIEDATFSQCSSLVSVVFKPNSGLESIGNNAFQLCSSLTDITIPGSVTQIDQWAFDQCTNLRNVSFGPNSKLKTLVQGAFQSCSGLASITIPETVSAIGRDAFWGCAGLNYVVFKGKAETISDGAFDKDRPDSSLAFYIPEDQKTYYANLLNNSVMGGTKAEIRVIYKITAVEPFQNKTVPKGTAQEDLNLPGSLKVIAGGAEQTIDGVTWVPDRTYDPNTEGVYYFTAVLPPYYEVASPLKITVNVSNPGTSSGNHENDHSAAKTPAAPTAVTDAASGAAADLSAFVLPSGVTGVSLNVAKEGPADKSDRQAEDFSRALLADPKAGVIGNPVIYNMELLDRNGSAVSGTGKIRITIPVPAGLRGTPHVLRYEPSGVFTDTGAILENGMLVFETDRLGYFAAAGMGDSITLDTTNYAMPVNGSYEIGLRITGTRGTSLNVHSTDNDVAGVTKLPNGNYRVTGTKGGTVWIMFDVYDNKNKLLTHASVRVDVKSGIHPRGGSARQIGVF